MRLLKYIVIGLLLWSPLCFAATDTLEGQELTSDATIEGVSTTDTVEGQEITTGLEAIAQWSFDNGALTTDSLGSNTLVLGGGSPVADTGDYQEGDASVDMTAGDGDYYYVTDANLAVDFPTKSGDTTPAFTVCTKFKADTTTAEMHMVSKYVTSGDLRSWSLELDASNNVIFRQGHTTGTSFDNTTCVYGTAIADDVWYYVCAGYDDSDKSCRIRIYDYSDSLQLGTDKTATFSNAMSVRASIFEIGSWATGQNRFDGWLDDTRIFDSKLTPAQMDAER